MIKIYEFVFKKWLYNSFHKNYNRIIKIKGIKTFLIEDSSGNRSTIEPLFFKRW